MPSLVHAAHGVTRLPTLVCSLAENKFCNRQIARVSDFEIKVVIENDSDLVAESLDCGDFVGDENIFRVNGGVGILDQFSLENLWRLHCIQLMPVD